MSNIYVWYVVRRYCAVCNASEKFWVHVFFHLYVNVVAHFLRGGQLSSTVDN